MATFNNEGNSFGIPAVLGTNDNESLTIRTNSASAVFIGTDQSVQFDGTVSMLQSLSVGIAGGRTGSITLVNIGNANTFTQQSAATTSSYTISWPPAVAIAGQVLTDEFGNGILSWKTPVANASTFFKRNGNSFGADVSLGTLDNYNLTLITNGLPAMTITGLDQGVAFNGSIAGNSLQLGKSNPGGITGELLLINGTGPNAGVFAQVSGVTAGNGYAITWPPFVANAGQVLTDAFGNGVLSWTTPANASTFFKQGGNSFGTPAILGTFDNNPLTIYTNGQPAISINQVQNVIFSSLCLFKRDVSIGAISGPGAHTGSLVMLNAASTVAFTQQAGATTGSGYTIVWPPAVAIAGQVLTDEFGDGVLSWTTPAANADTFFKQGGNSFGHTAVLGTNDNNQLSIITNGTPAITIDSFSQSAQITGYLTCNKSIQAGIPGSNGQLIMRNALGGSFIQQASAISSGTYVITWPPAVAQAGQVLTDAFGNGVLSWTTPANASTFFKQGGNSFGQPATLGTFDNQQLNIDTNGQLAVLIDTNQNATFTSTILTRKNIEIGVSSGFPGAFTGYINMRHQNSTGVFSQYPGTITGIGYAITWPPAVAQAGQVLTDAFVNVLLSWETPANASTFFKQGGNSFGQPATLGTFDNYPLNIYANGQLALSFDTSLDATFISTIITHKNIDIGISNGFPGAFTGYIVMRHQNSNGVFIQQPGNMTGIGYTITWPPAVAQAGQVLTDVYGNGNLSWITPTVSPGSFFQQNGNSFNQPAVLGTNDSNTLTIITNGQPAISINQIQDIVFSSLCLFKRDVSIGAIIGPGAHTGSLVMLNEFSNVAFTQQAGATSGSGYTIVWPPAVASPGQVLADAGGNGILSWITVAPTPGSFFQLNGNSFGQQAILGTTDYNQLSFITNGTTAIIIDQSQTVTFPNSPVFKQDVAIGAGSGPGAHTGQLTMYNANSLGTFVQKAGNLVGNGYTIIWPPNIASAGQVLTDPFGNGVLSWGSTKPVVQSTTDSQPFGNATTTFIATSTTVTITLPPGSSSGILIQVSGSVGASNTGCVVQLFRGSDFSTPLGATTGAVGVGVSTASSVCISYLDLTPPTFTNTYFIGFKAIQNGQNSQWNPSGFSSYILATEVFH